jgi:hypothetical protein
MCIPGWTPTEANVSKLVDTVKEVPGYESAIVVLDVLSNVAYRFEQEEGESFLPVKISGKYHMVGTIVGSTREQIFTCLNKLKPLLEILKGEKIFVSPLPRYIYVPCCDAEDHCLGLGSELHAAGIIDIAGTVRKYTRDYLHSRVSRVWVPDVLPLLVPGSTKSGDIAIGLKNMAARDGVHLTVDGYDKLTVIVEDFLKSKISAADLVSGSSNVNKAVRNKTFYWKGFVSPVGSSRPTNMAAFHDNRTGGKPRPSGYHPYAKFKK